MSQGYDFNCIFCAFLAFGKLELPAKEARRRNLLALKKSQFVFEVFVLFFFYSRDFSVLVSNEQVGSIAMI